MRFRSDPRGITGSIAPLVTPFTAVGEVDHDGLVNLVKCTASRSGWLG